jgi:hypothetical protein
MHADIQQLAEDSGPLLVVTGLPVAGNRFRALFFEFENGTVQVGCDDDTDEVVVALCEGPKGQPVGPVGALTGLEGLVIEYAWDLRNHRGYLDAFQLRLRDSLGRDETRQFEVAASAIDVRRVAA